MKENLKGLTLSELEAKMVGLGHSAFRGRQLFRWIHNRRESNFNNMTDLHKSFREELNAKFELPQVKVTKAEHSKEDGTAKYLVELPDGQTVESVFIPSAERNTLCVSTQVGCKMACTFCATGRMGLGFVDHVINLVLLEIAGTRDRNLLLAAGGLVLGGQVHDTTQAEPLSASWHPKQCWPTKVMMPIASLRT